MILLPFTLMTIPNCPGYFYHRLDKKVYSIKSGTLTPLKKHRAWHTFSGRIIPAGFDISINGERQRLSSEYLDQLHKLEDNKEIHILPIKD